MEKSCRFPRRLIACRIYIYAMNSNSSIKKIAFADDHNAVREGLVSCIEENKRMKVIIQAENGQEMLDLLLLSDELPDVCLIDISMPVMNGYTLLREIKRRWPDMPCLILSAFSHEHHVIELIRAGANGYLLKSCSPDELRLAIKKVIAKGYYYNETMNQKKVDEAFSLNSKIKPIVLSEREIEFMKLACGDLSYADIAIQMGTTFKTIDGMRARLFEKLNINSRINLVIVAIRLGYFTVEDDIILENEHKKSKKL